MFIPQFMRKQNHIKNLPILRMNSVKTLKEFILFWSSLYYYPLEAKYNNRIHNQQYSEDDINELFWWKNGMKLSSRKQKSVDDKIISKLLLINDLKNQDRIEIIEFKNQFSDLSAVWKIFLLHIIKPFVYPIYDQNVHRAYNFIHGLDYNSISSDSISNKRKEEFYFNTYFNFIDNLNGIELKKMDEAFFTFGKFIKTNNEGWLVDSSKTMI
jgi:hypothetical protein